MYPMMTDTRAVRAIGAHRDQRMNVAVLPSGAERPNTVRPLAERLVLSRIASRVLWNAKRLQQRHAES